MSWFDLGWFFALSVTIHNIEEALYLPRWSKRAGRWHSRVSAFEFRFAVFVLTAVAYGVVFLARAGGTGSVGAYLLAGYALAMLLNVFFPHLLATLGLRRYCPGLITALFLNLPVCLLILYTGFRDGHIAWGKFLWYGPACVAGLLLAIPVLFMAGRGLSPR